MRNMETNICDWEFREFLEFLKYEIEELNLFIQVISGITAERINRNIENGCLDRVKQKWIALRCSGDQEDSLEEEMEILRELVHRCVMSVEDKKRLRANRRKRRVD